MPVQPDGQAGYSRDSRPDCLQVCIGLVVTTDGIPLGYEVFDGNTHDSKTVETIVQAMEAKYGRANRIWVMDRGMVSEDNLKFLCWRGGSYIVGTPNASAESTRSPKCSHDFYTKTAQALPPGQFKLHNCSTWASDVDGVEGAGLAVGVRRRLVAGSGIVFCVHGVISDSGPTLWAYRLK